MKLYTEEQVIKIIERTKAYKSYSNNQLIQTLTPIELPSDEEIGKEMDKLPFSKHVDDGLFNDGQLMGFELGAKWNKYLTKTNNL